jgi:hypothetical protein
MAALRGQETEIADLTLHFHYTGEQLACASAGYERGKIQVAAEKHAKNITWQARELCQQNHNETQCTHEGKASYTKREAILGTKTKEPRQRETRSYDSRQLRRSELPP